MKSPFEKLKKFGLNKSEPKENWDHHILVHADGLTQAAKDVNDMRTCYDSLLSAAAATTNSAYEFSESFMEMGEFLLEKTAVHDGETGGALSMLGGVQIELQKIVDNYRSRIIETITNPSESLLNELRKVEEMKLQCDEKRELFEHISGQLREKGKSRHGRETVTSEKLQVVCEEYDDAARLCIFRVGSLKQGQWRSLLTQAARHHAAQLDFFRKGLQSLEAVEPRIRSIIEQQRIDCALSVLNDCEEEDDEDSNFQANDVGELSFDYRRNKKEIDHVTASRDSMELDHPDTHPSRKEAEVQISIGTHQGEPMPKQQHRVSSHSAPLYPDKFDPAPRMKEMRTDKFSTHVLPTPADAKGSIASGSASMSLSNIPILVGSKNLWHSSPLDNQRQKKTVDNHLSAHNSFKIQTGIEDNISGQQHSHPLPRPETSFPQFETHTGLDTQKMKRQAFSGPLASKPSSSHTSGPMSYTEIPQSRSGVIPRVPLSVNVSQNASPPPGSSPKISELHELPRPPDSGSSKPIRSMGHSAPLGNINQDLQARKNTLRSPKGGSPLPLPHLTVSRSFSIPSSSQRTTPYNSGKLLQSSQVLHNSQDVASPPLTPMSLSNMKSPNSGRLRVDAGSR